METHIKVIGVLNILIGGGGLVAALVFFLLFGGASYSSDSIPLRGFLLVGDMIVMILLALPMIIVGVALLQFKPWSRMAAVILAAFTFLHMPFGFALAIYELSILLSHDVDTLFNPRFDTLYLRRP